MGVLGLWATLSTLSTCPTKAAKITGASEGAKMFSMVKNDQVRIF